MFGTKQKHKCEIKEYKGINRIFIDGEQITPMCYQFMPSDPELTNNIPLVPIMDSEIQLKAMGEAGIKLYFIRLEVHDPKDIDIVFDKFRRSVKLLRECVPGAFAAPWMIISPYEEFYLKYPDDVQTFDDGTTGNYSGNLSGRIADSTIPRHTHASLAWRHEFAGFLREFVRQIQDDEVLSDAVVGYFLFPLQHEGKYFYDYDHSAKLDDYSKPMKLAFRNYLAEKYHGNTECLRKAWNNKDVTFETAELPTRAEREAETAGKFWDPSLSQKVMDYAEIRSHVWFDTLDYFCRAIKEESGGRALVGAFWAYLIHGVLWGGHCYFRKLLSSPFIDFLASPMSYENKTPGHATAVRFLARSMQKHGKIFFEECDSPTSTSDARQRLRGGMAYDGAWKDEGVLKRDFIYALTEGMQGWWVDWPSGTAQYDENGLLPLMKRMQAIGAEAKEKPMGSVAEIAALVQQEGFYSAPTSTVPNTAVERNRIFSFGYTGAPIDYFEWKDAAEEDFDYKLVLILNAYNMPAYERRGMAEILRKKGRTLFFCHASGYLSPDAPTASAENVTELTGIKVREEKGVITEQIELTEAASVIGLKAGDIIGGTSMPLVSNMNFSGESYLSVPEADPVFVIDDKDAVILGKYKDNGLPAFAVKEINGCRCFYYGAQFMDPYVLRAVAGYAGVHIYTDNDCAVYANQSYVGVHTVTNGKFMLHLPKKCAIRDAFSGKFYEASDGIALELSDCRTMLFEYIDE